MAEWFERVDDAIWYNLADRAVDKKEALFIIKALNLDVGEAVLDAPCGNGRISLHLARHGCKLTGVDINSRFLFKARRKLAIANLGASFVNRDLRDLNIIGEFDAIVNWFGSFGYFSDQENLDVLSSFRDALKFQGRLLIDQPNRENLLRNLHKIRPLAGAEMQIRWQRKSQQLVADWTLNADPKKQTFRTLIRLYTPTQFSDILRRTGFKLEKVYGNANGDPFTKTSKRYILVARKI